MAGAFLENRCRPNQLSSQASRSGKRGLGRQVSVWGCQWYFFFTRKAPGRGENSVQSWGYRVATLYPNYKTRPREAAGGRTSAGCGECSHVSMLAEYPGRSLTAGDSVLLRVLWYRVGATLYLPYTYPIPRHAFVSISGYGRCLARYSRQQVL